MEQFFQSLSLGPGNPWVTEIKSWLVAQPPENQMAGGGFEPPTFGL